MEQDHLALSSVGDLKVSPTSIEPSLGARMINLALKRWCETFPDWGDVVSPQKAKLYERALSDVPTPILAEALKRTTRVAKRFPVPGDVNDHVEAIRAEKATEKRKNANCPRCEGTGWRYADPDNARAGVKPCDCRPAPPELASPRTPVEGLTHELAVEIMAAADGRAM